MDLLVVTDVAARYRHYRGPAAVFNYDIIPLPLKTMRTALVAPVVKRERPGCVAGDRLGCAPDG